jgi:trehalose-6-phosphate synthase
MFNFVWIKGFPLDVQFSYQNMYTFNRVMIAPLKLTSDKLKRQASRRDNMKNAKRILEKFDNWKYDIYESNRLDWTKQDDNDVNEIEKLLKEQATSEQKR